MTYFHPLITGILIDSAITHLVFNLHQAVPPSNGTLVMIALAIFALVFDFLRC